MQFHSRIRKFSRLELVLIAGVVVLVAVIVGLLVDKNNLSKRSEQPRTSAGSNITSFDDCVAAGNPVMESYPEQCSANGTTFVNEDMNSSNGYTTVESGQGLFKVSFPDGWSDVYRAKDSDSFKIAGQKQPVVLPGTKAIIKDTESFGGDGVSLFTILVSDNIVPPEGEESDYTLVNGKQNSILGKKYTKIYATDELVGIGIQRFAGDRDYEYSFMLNDGRELRIWYSVYGSDPRNNVGIVEQIIDSIRLKT